MIKKISIPLILTLLIGCTQADQQILLSESYNADLGNMKTENALADLSDLFTRLEEVHYNPYLHISKKELGGAVDKVVQQWLKQDSIPAARFILETMQLIARLEDGHTNIIWYSTEVLPQRDSMDFFPVKMGIRESGKLMITDTTFKNLLAKEINTINGYDAGRLYKEALACLPGNPEHVHEITEALFFPVYLYLRGITPPYLLQFESHDLVEIDPSDTRTFIDLYRRLQPGKRNYEYEPLEKEQIALIHYNSCTDYEAFDAFLQSTFQQIKEKGFTDLIIDIRYNSGGNSSLNDLLLAYITDKPYRQASKRFWKVSDVAIAELKSRGVEDMYGPDFLEKYSLEGDSILLDFGGEEPPQKPEPVQHFFEGSTYVLIGPKTFSSANMLADAIATFKLSTLVGTPTGEMTNDFGEQKTELLNHSQLPFNFSIAYDIGADGNGKKIETVQPDILVKNDALSYTVERILKKRANK